MIARPLASFALIALASAGASTPQAAITTSQDLQRVCDEFYALELDPERTYDVKGAILVRDIATIQLTSGTVIYSRAIEGVTPVAIFIGKGSFTVSPARRMDSEMLSITAREHLNKDVGGMINTPVTEAFFASFEESWSGLDAGLAGPRRATAEELRRGSEILKGRLEILDRTASITEFSLISRILDDPQGEGAFQAEVKSEEHGWLALRWDPASTYEVRLFTREPVGVYYMTEGLVRAHQKQDLDAKGRYVADPRQDLGEAIKVKHYRMNLEIPDLQQILIDVDVTFEPQSDDLKLVWFDLVNDIYGPEWDSRAKWIDVESLTDAAGTQLARIHRKNRVVILPATSLKKGEATTWSFKLRENTLIQLSNVHWLMLNTYPWFPQYGYLGGQYSFDWTVKTVKPITVTGSGKALRTWEEANMNAVEMNFERPVQFPSLIFGRYQAESGQYQSTVSGSAVDLNVHYWPVTLFKIVDRTTCELLNVRCPLDIELTVPRNKPGDVIGEAKEILKFMEDLYGPFPYDKLDVAMMAPGLGFGQAPPAFVQLTGEAFMSSSAIADAGFSNPDFFHEFFSHEIAHQWWGHKIGWVADEDQWLSESFAEYAAGLYVGSYLGKKRYLEKLREWKDNARIGDPHGSIAWSNNLSGPQGGQRYQALIYNKGPYVVHMLRMLMGMDKFKAAMQAVFASHGYTNVTTAALQRECEKQMGYSLDFFFDQWFRGTGIPVFDYDWKSEPAGEGKHLVTVNISQRDKQNFKQVLMPVYFHFKGQDEALVKARPITEADHVYKVMLPQKPVRVVLDEDHDILGDMIPASGSGM